MSGDFPGIVDSDWKDVPPSWRAVLQKRKDRLEKVRALVFESGKPLKPSKGKICIQCQMDTVWHVAMVNEDSDFCISIIYDYCSMCDLFWRRANSSEREKTK